MVALHLEERLARIPRALSAAALRVRELNAVVENNASSQRVHTVSHVEVDVASPELDVELQQKHCPDAANVLSDMAQILKKTKSNAIQDLAMDNAAFEKLSEHVDAYISERIAGESIVDILGRQLIGKDPGERNRAYAKIQAAVEASATAWQADSGLLDLDFTSHLAIAIPTGGSEVHREVLSKSLEEAATVSQIDSR